LTASAWTPAAVSVLVYTIITMVIGREVLAHLGSMIANDPGDPLLTAAILKWNATHVPFTDAWYQFPIFFPTRDTLTFSEHLLGLSVIASPIYWLTRDAVATYNLSMLLTFPLCAAAMYALVFRLTRSAGAAFVAGLAFGFAPYRVSQLPHIQMLAAFWAPLALLGLHAYVETGRRRWLALYGASWMLQGAANGYALVFFSILVGLWVLWFVAIQRKWRALVMIAVATMVSAIPLAPVLYEYISVHAYYGFERGFGEMRFFSADVANVLCAPPKLTFWGWVRVMCGPEKELFPGVALIAISILGPLWLLTRSSGVRTDARIIVLVRRLLLFVASVYGAVVLALLVSGPFAFYIGPLKVSASTMAKPIEIAVACLIVLLALSSGVRDTLRRSGMLGFFWLASIGMWVLALGPIIGFMGRGGIPGPFRWLMFLPGVDSLRVPARFWLMAVLCLSVVAGIVLGEVLRGRSRRVMLMIVLLAGTGVLTDGWIDRIDVASVPGQVPGAAQLRGATVLELPSDTLFRDIAAVFRAVDGEWTSVNGYSGWGPSYYQAFFAAGRAEVDDALTPFQRRGELHVIVGRDAPRLRTLVERQPGVSTEASDASFVHYRLPQRQLEGIARPKGQRLTVRQLQSLCSTTALPSAIDGDEESLWQCTLSKENQTLTVDLGSIATVGAVVHSLGNQFSMSPLSLTVETSDDGLTWGTAWTGTVLAKAIVAGMEDPKRMRIVVAFPPREARFVRLQAEVSDPEIPWTIAELELWSSSETH